MESDVIGLCVYCGGPAKHTCKLCGVAVCPEHYDKGKGVCYLCIKGKRQ